MCLAGVRERRKREIGLFHLLSCALEEVLVADNLRAVLSNRLKAHLHKLIHVRKDFLRANEEKSEDTQAYIGGVAINGELGTNRADRLAFFAFLMNQITDDDVVRNFDCRHKFIRSLLRNASEEIAG